MQLSVKINSAVASARLWALMLRIRNPEKLHKFWGIRVMNQARANARAKGGRTLWKQIADEQDRVRKFTLYFRKRLEMSKSCDIFFGNTKGKT